MPDAEDLAKAKTQGFYENAYGGSTGGSVPPAPPSSPPPAPDDNETDPFDFDDLVVTRIFDEEEMLRRFPNMRYMLGIPELKGYLQASYEKGWSDEEFKSWITQSYWWRTRSGAARDWDLKAANDPAQASRERQARRTYLSQQAGKLGVVLTGSDLDDLVEQTLRWNFTIEEMNASLGASTKELTFGDITATADRIQADSRSYYLDWDRETALDMARKIETGSLSYDAVTSNLKRQATINYSQFADDIADNMTLEEATYSLRSAVATTLDMSPNDIDFRDAAFSDLLNFTDDNGKKIVPTIGQGKSWARQTDLYQHTDEFGKNAQNLVTNLTKMMGTSAVLR